MSDQLFESAHSAMRFALNYQGNPSMSVMNRISQKPSGMPSKGLSGLDGAAESGIIRARMHSLGYLHEAILIADIAPRSKPCTCRSSCCSGQSKNQEWLDAINWLSDNVRIEALESHRTTHPIRRACVEIYFGAKITAVKISYDLGVCEKVAGEMIRKVRRYLKSEHERALIGADNVLHDKYAELISV